MNKRFTGLLAALMLLLVSQIGILDASAQELADCSIILETGLIEVPSGTLDQVTGSICTDGSWGEQAQATAQTVVDVEDSPFLTCSTFQDAEPGSYETTDSSSDGFIQFLLELDPIYRNDGPLAWARAMGLSWDGELCATERQPEELTVLADMKSNSVLDDEDRTVVIKIQFQTPENESIHMTWPGSFSTDRTGAMSFDDDGGAFQPDTNNPSWVCTNCWLDAGSIPFSAGPGGNESRLWPENRTIPNDMTFPETDENSESND